MRKDLGSIDKAGIKFSRLKVVFLAETLPLLATLNITNKSLKSRP